MKMLRTLFLVAIVLLSTAATCSAGDWITQTKCDTTSVAGITYPIVDFKVTNLYPDPKYPICMILLIPKTPSTVADTCRAIAAFGNPGWDRDADPNGRVIWIQNASELDCIWPGSTGSGFRLVLTHAHSCCYQVEFYGSLFEPFAADEVCFDCDLPTAAKGSTWGHVKAVYR